MLAIKNNIMAANAARHLGKAYDSLARSVERLASGLRINSAKDDAAGLAVRELIRADVAVLQQGSRNAQDGISMLQTMEGAMAVIDQNLIRMKELAEQAATGSYSSAQRDIMNSEFSEMASEIDRIAAATAFNDITMLNSATGDVKIHVGTTSTINIDNVDMTTSSSGLNIATGTSGFQSTATAGVTLSSTGTYFTVAATAAATDAVEMTITFSDTGGTALGAENTITVNFALLAAETGGKTYTLDAIVDLINTQSQNINLNDSEGNTLNYAMASAELDTGSNTYKLKLISRGSGADLVDIDISATQTAASVSGFVTVGSVALTAGTDLDELDGSSSFTSIAGTGISIDSTTNAMAALIRVTSAIKEKDENRAKFGYKMNRLETTIAILDIQSENLMAAESRISDVDVATEMATLTRTQVLSQAGVAMLAQANTMPQMALTLLR